MGKDPAVLWYWNDWHGGTVTFSRHLKGCYMDLLYAQFNNGHLSLEEIRTVLGTDFSAWNTLQKKFAQDATGKFFNERLEQRISERREYSKKQSDRVKKRWAKKPEYGNTVVLPKKEIEDEIEDEIKNNGDARGKLIYPFNTETFKTAWEAWKQYKKEQHRFTYKGEHSEQMALKELSELSENSESKAFEIIQQSMSNGWKGLFELKNNQNGKPKFSGKLDTERISKTTREFLQNSGLGRKVS